MLCGWSSRFTGQKWELLLLDPWAGTAQAKGFREAPGRAVPSLHTGALQFPEGLAPASKRVHHPPPRPRVTITGERPLPAASRGNGRETLLSMAPVGQLSESPFPPNPVSDERQKCLPCSILRDPARAGAGEGRAQQARASCPPATKSTLSPVLPMVALKTQITGHRNFQGPRVK